MSHASAAVILIGALSACGAPRSAAGVTYPTPVADTATVADTVAPAWAVERDLGFTSDELRLAGTLTLPAQPVGSVPVVLMVAGSGPTDRDGNNPPMLMTNTLAQLAWGLARWGVASYRYDKRGVGESDPPPDVARTLASDFRHDATAAARMLANDARFSRVILLGHSEGAQHVVQAANRGAPASGLILVSGYGRSITEVLREQVARLLEPASLAQFDTALARYLRGEDPGEVSPALRPLFLPHNQRFLQSLAEFDVAAELARLEVPVMIVHGRRDLQVTDADAEALAAARPGATVLMLPEANHNLKRTTEMTPQGQLPTYRDPTLPLDPGVLVGVVEWIRGQEAGGTDQRGSSWR